MTGLLWFLLVVALPVLTVTGMFLALWVGVREGSGAASGPRLRAALAAVVAAVRRMAWTTRCDDVEAEVAAARRLGVPSPADPVLTASYPPAGPVVGRAKVPQARPTDDVEERWRSAGAAGVNPWFAAQIATPTTSGGSR